MTKRFVFDFLKYVMAFGLLGGVIWWFWGKPEDGQGLAFVWQRHVVQGVPANYGSFALMFTFLTCAALLTLIRWYYLVRATGLPFRLVDAIRLGFIGVFFSAFLPGSIGGDIIKAVFIAREQSRRAVAVATVVIDRAIALWGLFWFVAVLGLFFWVHGDLTGEVERPLKSIVLIAVGVVMASVVVWILLGLLSAEGAERFANRVEGRLGHGAAEAWRAVWMYRQQPRVVALAMLIALIGHVGFVLTFHFASLTLWDGQPLPDGRPKIPSLQQHFIIVPIGMVVQAVPLFPGGVGVGELGFGGLYKLIDCNPPNGVLGSLMQRVGMWILALVGLVIYMQMRPALKPAALEADLADAEVSSSAIPSPVPEPPVRDPVSKA